MLVLVQGLHSIEEFHGSLWEVFPPARFLTSLVSENLETDFLINNIGLFIFGLWCWLLPVRRNKPSATGFIRFWIIVELINGVGHPVWALYEGGYVLGLVSDTILLIMAIFLGMAWRRTSW